jgi:carboxyl-terminal processing protease
MFLVKKGRMSVPALVCVFSALCSFASVSGAAPSTPDETFDPWRGTGIDLGFLDDKISTANCSRSDRELLSCIGAVQRVLDLEGHGLELIPVTNLVDEADWEKVLERFGAAAVVKDAATRIGAAGNALEAIRARTHRILRWRDRLDPGLRNGVDFTAIRNWLKTDVIDSRRRETFAAAAVNGYLSVADAHARIAPSATNSRSSGARRGINPAGSRDALVYTGIGAGVQPMADAAIVTAVVRDGPAAKAGLRVHDFILEIDGRSVTGLSGDALVERLRGRDGTQVGLKVKRQDDVMELSVRRDAVTVKNVFSDAFVDRGWRLAYLKIDSFLRPNTCGEFRRELSKRLKPNLNGLLLDLRDNAGGLIDQAVCVADLLLPEDEVVLEIRSVDGGKKKEQINTKHEARARVPMVTLVNATTGSASELLSGALQDHSRSLIVGELTFGKGTVQTVRPWQGSRSIMEFFTAARYYRPSGVGVQLIGIEPDIEVFERPGTVPRDRIVLREQDLFPTALPLERQVWKHPDPARVKELRECAERKGLAVHRMRPDAEMSRATDYQLAVAQDALVCSLTRRR